MMKLNSIHKGDLNTDMKKLLLVMMETQGQTPLPPETQEQEARAPITDPLGDIWRWGEERKGIF